MPQRFCKIVSAAVELQNGAGDGAYDLHDAEGTPEDIGKAIAESLRETCMMQGRATYPDDGTALYLNVRIKFANHDITDDEE